MVYQEFRHECYGSGGIFGHKFWVNLSSNPDKRTLGVLLGKLSNKAKERAVILNGQTFPATEVTIFIYYNRQPATDKDNWSADKVMTAPL